MNIKRYTLVVLSIFSFWECFGQPAITNPPFLPKVFASAPNSASLGKFGNYPVSYYTGVPDISIPLYSIKAGNVDLPISLSYHASGIKVSEISSWVGLGWSLQFGGQITRRMMGGKADEDVNGYLGGRLKTVGQINTAIDATHDYLTNVDNGYYDTEPDIFSYSFPGKGGKFFFNSLNGYKPSLIPYAPISIKTVGTGLNIGFNILDEQGNNFSFGTQERTQSYRSGIESYSTSAWMLDKVISSNLRDTVDFTYKSQYVDAGHDDMDTWVVEDQAQATAPYCSYSGNAYSSITSSLTSSNTTEDLISEINFKNGKVKFILSAADREDNRQGVKKLDSVKVYNYNSLSKTFDIQKSYRFYQSYFIQGTNINTKRLRLDSLDLVDNTGKMVERYRYSYNTSVVLPEVNSKSRDYWGYYNGKPNNTLIPQQSISFENCAGCAATNVTIGSTVTDGRQPDSTYNQACILKRISFPTGGYTDFMYESNRYLDGTFSLKLGGGLRIKTITSYPDQLSAPIVKNYKYGDSEKGYGRANFDWSTYYWNTTQNYRYFFYFNTGNGVVGTKRVRTYISNPTMDMEGWDGVSVTYPTVTEYMGDKSSNLGKTVFQFQDQADGTRNVMVKPYRLSHFYNRGQLLSKSVYKSNSNASYNLIESEANSYTAFPVSSYDAVGLVVMKTMINDGSSTGIRYPSSELPSDQNSWSFANYSIESDDNYLISTSKNTYDPSDETKYVTTNTNSTYGNITHQQPTKVTVTDSKGNTQSTNYKYPADYVPAPGSSSGSTVLDNMLTQNIQANPIESYSNLLAGATTTVTGGQITLYKQLPSGATVPDQQRKLDVGSPLTDFVPLKFVNNQAVADSRYRTIGSYDSYDDKANILQYTSGNAPSVSVLWNKSKTLPIAQITNSKYNQQTSTSTSVKSGTISYNSSNYGQAQTLNFSVNLAGTISLKMSFGGAPGSTTAAANYSYSLTGPSARSGSLCISADGSCSNSAIDFTSMPTGNYTLTTTYNSNTAGTTVNINCSYPALQVNFSEFKEFYAEDFEEDAGASAVKPHTGLKGNFGRSFSVPFALPNARAYLIGWSQWDGTKWVYNQEAYTGSKVFASTVYVDDIRVFPADGQITTYTYLPLVGITSSIDTKGMTSYYEYDSAQRLLNIKDQNGNILKNYDYHFKGQ